MKHDELIAQVQHHARLASRGEAEVATRATLETLAERLAGGEAEDLASQLPRGIAEYLRTGQAGTGQHFPVEEFFQRVSQREGGDVAKAIYHARAVITVYRLDLRLALSGRRFGARSTTNEGKAWSRMSTCVTLQGNVHHII